MRKVHVQKKPLIENVELKKKKKISACADVRNKTLNKLVDSVPDGLIGVIKN